jgi:hypothetical protein
MKATHSLGLALLALALTACSSSAKSATGAHPIAATNPTASVPATVAAPSPTAALTTEAQITTPTTPARPGPCVSSDLRVSLGQSQGGAGTFYIALLLTNRSRVTCTLDGYPGVSFVGGTDAHQIGTPAQPDRRVGAAPLTLVPGATVHVTVAVADYANYDKQTCQPARATGYRIFPPGSTGSLLISAPQMVCSKPGLQGFRTSVVLPGKISD